MKKLAITIGCAMAVTGAAFAQGTLNWAAPGGTFTAQTNTITSSFVDGGAAVTGGSQTSGNAASATGGYYYELLYSTTAFNGSAIAQPNSTAALFGGTWQDVGLTMTNQSGSTGRLQPLGGAQAQAATPAGMGPGGIGTGQTNYIELVGWSANLGSSWSVVSNELATGSWATINAGALANGGAFFGESQTGYLVANTTGNQGAAVFFGATDANGLPLSGTSNPLFELVTTVPEPGTMALAGLGGLSLLLFRRRK